MGFTWFRKVFQGNPTGSSHFGGSPFSFFSEAPLPGNYPANHRTLGQVAFDYVLARNGEGEHKLQALTEHATRDVFLVFGTGAGEPRDRKRELRLSFVVFKLFLRLKQILLTDILDMFEGFKEIWPNSNEIAGLV